MKRIINRRTFVATHGNHRAAVDLLTAAGANSPHQWRVYTSHFGTLDEVVLETEFDSMAQMLDAWDEISTRPTMSEFMQKWNPLIQSGGRNEVYVREASN